VGKAILYLLKLNVEMLAGEIGIEFDKIVSVCFNFNARCFDSHFIFDVWGAKNQQLWKD
jgi:hypothetical protein